MYPGEKPTSGLKPIPCTNCGKHERQYPYTECVFSRLERGHDSTCVACKVAGKHLCSQCDGCRKVCKVIKDPAPFLDPT